MPETSETVRCGQRSKHLEEQHLLPQTPPPPLQDRDATPPASGSQVSSTLLSDHYVLGLLCYCCVAASCG